MAEERYQANETPMMPVDLRKDGLLWLINTTVFHPRGYALAIEEDGSAFYLMGHGKERWSYAEGSISSEGYTSDDLFWMAQQAFARATQHNIGEAERRRRDG